MPKRKPPKHSVIRYDSGEKIYEYIFHYYVNENKRYVALCNTVGGHDLHGEGHTWWSALTECWEKVQRRIDQESRKRKKPGKLR